MINNKESQPFIELSDVTQDNLGDINDYICKICSGIIYQAVSDHEGHMFCKQCIHRHVERTNKCPVTEHLIKKDQLFKVDIIDKVIGKKTVYCKNRSKGCEWIGAIVNLVSHKENECMFEVIRCPNRGCSQYLKRDDLPEHHTDCNYREVECPNNCGTVLNMVTYMNHGDDCPRLPINCPQNCGELLERKNKDSHLKECRNSLIDCRFIRFGCESRYKIGELENHFKDNIVSHMVMLGDFVLDSSVRSKSENPRVINKSPPRKDIESIPQSMKRVGKVKRGRGRPPKHRRAESSMEKQIPSVSRRKPVLDESEQSEDSEFKYRGNTKRLFAKRTYKKREKYIVEDNDEEEAEFSSIHEDSEKSEKPIKPPSQPKSSFQHIKSTNVNPDAYTKRKRGRPPKNAQKPQVIPSSVCRPEDQDDEEPKPVKRFKKDESTSHSLVKIDKLLLDPDVTAEDDYTAVLTNPRRNTHKLVFGTVDVRGIDFTWGIKINKLGPRSWIGFGLCKKNKIFEQTEKFSLNSNSHHCFLISGNKNSWNSDNLDENQKNITFPRVTSGAVIEMRYFHQEKELQFIDKDEGSVTKLTMVDSDSELVPLVILLTEADDSFTFI
jgi:hypothetical protein